MKHIHVRGIVAGGLSLNYRVEAEAGQELNIDESIPVGNNQLLAFVCDVSQLKSFFLVADGALTVETNSGGSPANTITLAANEPFSWVDGDPTLRDTGGTAITTDITALYITNATSGPVKLKIFALVDPTV